jgi:hypothetical protein
LTADSVLGDQQNDVNSKLRAVRLTSAGTGIFTILALSPGSKMDCLEDNQICEWAVERGLRRGNGFAIELPELEPHPRNVYARGRRSGLEAASARDLIAALGAWDECLVWVTLWGVWSSGEDWPEFYAWRGSLGERRSLDVAPGHRFDKSEVTLLAQLLELVMKNAWDADILCSRSGRANQLRARISHDEWYQVLG